MSWLERGGTDIVCYCKNVNKMDILTAITNEGARNLEDIKRITGACTGSDCATMNPSGRCCEEDIMEILRLYLPVFDDLQKGHDEGDHGCAGCTGCDKASG